MIMPGSPRISGEAFAIERLREDPNLDFASIRRQAAEAGVSMAPIQYGRARRHLGLPPKTELTRPPAVVKPNQPRFDPMAEPVVAPTGSAAADDEHDEPDSGRMAADADEPNDAPADGGADQDIVAPRRKGSAAFDWLVQELRREPHASFGELRQRAEAVGLSIMPIMYGRAKAKLGLVPVKPRGKAKKDAAAAAVPSAPRSLKQVESVAADRFTQKLEEVRSLEQLVTMVKELDAERRRLRNLLTSLVTMIDEALE
jgi:transposase